jgi:hypothetical protein
VESDFDMKSNFQEEQRGYIKVHNICADMRAVWRPIINTDVGIDGQIEFLEIGEELVSTGKIIAVQVKSGDSYFRDEGADYFRYYAKPRHQRYWSRVNLPMLLILNHPERNLTLYARVKHQLLDGSAIYVPKINLLTKSSRKQLINIHDEDVTLIERLFNPEEIVTSFKKAQLRSQQRMEVNGLHFLLSCTTRTGRYFELRYARLKAALMHVVSPKSLQGEAFNEFVQRCVMKCWGYELVEPFEREFEEYWYERREMPDIVVPLTRKGHVVISHLWEGITEYLTHQGLRFSDVGIIRNLAEDMVRDAKSASKRLDKSGSKDNYSLDYR